MKLRKSVGEYWHHHVHERSHGQFMVKKSRNRYEREMVMDVSSSNMHPGIVDAGRQPREMVRVALPSARQKRGLDIPLL